MGQQLNRCVPCIDDDSGGDDSDFEESSEQESLEEGDLCTESPHSTIGDLPHDIGLPTVISMLQTQMEAIRFRSNPDKFNKEGFRESDMALLAGANPDAFPQVDRPPNNGKQEPKFAGAFEAFVQNTPAVDSQAWNLVKKCAKCGKPCATTMKDCNACGASLAEVEVTKANNLFMGFIFGIEKGPFPLRISMRHESNDLLVFDDPLAITRAHVLSVPTDVYCPDIRSLFTAPRAGIKLLERMDAAAWAVLKDGYLADKAWREKALSSEGNKMPVDKLRKHVIAAFNLPPSQYQLHLQYMLPPLLPQHIGVFKKGAHFVKGRHFPLDYVRDALEAFDRANQTIPSVTEMTADQLVAAIDALGVSYDKAHAADMEKLTKSNALLANYDEADFDCAIVGGKVINKDTGVAIDTKAAKDVDAADKLALQGYGRPYQDGKPGGVYYSYARAPAALPSLK